MIQRIIPKTVKTTPKVLSSSLSLVRRKMPKKGIAIIAIRIIANAGTPLSELFLYLLK
jgi:hypothetical protein